MSLADRHSRGLDFVPKAEKNHWTLGPAVSVALLHCKAISLPIERRLNGQQAGLEARSPTTGTEVGQRGGDNERAWRERWEADLKGFGELLSIGWGWLQFNRSELVPRKLNVFKKHEPRVLEEHGISPIFTSWLRNWRPKAGEWCSLSHLAWKCDFCLG